MGNASLRSPRGVTTVVGALPYDTDYAQLPHRPLTTLGAWPTAAQGVPTGTHGQCSEAGPPPEANWLSAHGGGMLCRGTTVRVGLTRGGGHEDRAGRMLEHLQRHAAAQPGGKLAAA